METFKILKGSEDYFSWDISDMPGIDPQAITHKLKVNPEFKPVKQKIRKFAPERNLIINLEVKNLQDNGLIRAIQYLECHSSKKEEQIPKVCIDFTYLNKACIKDNKACPKDNFPLPMIDTLVDATTCHQLNSFLNTYPAYNQILMHPDDQEKTSFRTEKGYITKK